MRGDICFLLKPGVREEQKWQNIELGNQLKPVQILWDVRCWHPNVIFRLLCILYMLWIPKIHDFGLQRPQMKHESQGHFQNICEIFI